MRIEETIVNLIFDAAKGTVTVSSREAVSGKPYGALPRPVRAGYTFEGWYLGDTLITEDTVLNSEEDVRLVARWSRAKGSKKASMLKKQKIAIAVLAVLTVVLIATLLVVNHVVTIYTLTDTYFVDGVEYSDKYVVKKKDGAYGLYDKDGNAMEQNEDGYFIAAKSGNQYSIDAESGEWELYAVVDYDSAGGELLGFSDRIMMFPQITQKNTYSIEVTNEHGSYRFYRDASGTVHIEGTEDSLVAYDQTLFASLCVSCGYTLTMQKLNLSPDYVAPRLPDGSVDYSAYGLADVYDEAGNLVYTPATYTVTKAIYANDGTCTADENTKYTVKVGDALLSGGGYYVQLVGRDAVYIVNSEIKNTVLQPVEALVTPAVIYPMSVSTYMMIQNFMLGTINVEEILKTDKDDLENVDMEPIVSFTYLDLENRTNTIYQSRPFLTGMKLMSGYEINDNNASAIMSRFYEMKYIACRELGVNKDTLKEYGLDQDVYYLSFASPVLDANNSITGYIDNVLLISEKTEDGTYYIASTLYDMIVEVDQYYLAFLEWEESDWYNSSFYQHNVAYVSKLNIKIGDKSFHFGLDNSCSYMFYETGEGKMAQIDLSKGSVSKNSDGTVIYTDENGVKHNVKSFDLSDGEYLIKIVDAVENRVSYEEFYKYLITIDRDGNRNLQITRKGDGDSEVTEDYSLTYRQDGVLKVGKAYSLVWRSANGEEFSVLGTYTGTDSKRYQDYFRLAYWQEVKTTDENGAEKYVWKRNAPSNMASNLILRDANGKVYELSVGSNNLLVYCEQYNGGKGDPHLLDYTIVNTYITDSGKEKTEIISGVDNFRKLYGDMLYFSIEGDADPKVFEQNMGVSMEEYIKRGDSACYATISYRVQDSAYAMNLHTAPSDSKDKASEQKYWQEDNAMDVVIRFYRYTEGKSLITVEVIEEYDENGNPISDPEKAAGRFYVLNNVLDHIVKDAEDLLAQTKVTPLG